MKSVEVLMATYNSERWLSPMLSSLANQTYQDFRLVVSDDCSIDGTVDILEEFASRFGPRMELRVNSAPSGSALRNFSGLMENSKADYVLFADHDDVWFPDKIEVLLKSIKETEDISSTEAPIYIFSDAEVIDADGNLQFDSFWEYKRIDPRLCTSLSRSLVCSGVLGCASVANRALMEVSSPVPVAATSHDWWASLLATAVGTVGFVNRPTLKYRIHGDNSSRPRRANAATLLKERRKAGVVRQGFGRRVEQANAILERLEDRLSPANRAVLEAFVALPAQGRLRRRLEVLRSGFLYPDIARNLAFLAFM